VGTAIFVMCITDTEHPPAAGIALGMVLNPWNLLTLAVIAGSILIMTAVKVIFGRLLYDLF
jgi:CBS-domain-containing membrane protein